MNIWLAYSAALAVAAIGVTEAAGDALPPQQISEKTAPRGDMHVGEVLAKRWCSGCHLVGGAKAGTDAAPTFQSIARDPSMDADHLRGFLSRPHTPMPPIPLSGVEVEDLIAYIQSTGAARGSAKP